MTLKRLMSLCLMAVGVGLSASPGQADGRLIVSTQGSVDKAVREYVIPKMKVLYGVEVSTTPSLSAPALAKAIAQKARPQIDVFLLDAGPWLQGRSAGLWADLPDNVPNLADVPAALRDPKGVAYTHLVLGLLYDSSRMKVPPTSLRDLEDPRFKGKIAVPTFSSTFAFALLAKLDVLAGGQDNPSQPLDAGFKALKRITPNISSYYGGGSQLVDLFKQHEIDVAWGASYVAQGMGNDANVKWIAPAEGAGLSTVYAAIAQGTTNAEAAARFIDLLISPEFQAKLAEDRGVGFVNTKTVLPAAFAQASPLTAEVIAKGTQPPWDVFNAHRVGLNERWQREVETR